MIFTVRVIFFTDRWKLNVGKFFLVVVLLCVYGVRRLFIEGFLRVFDRILVHTHLGFRMK